MSMRGPGELIHVIVNSSLATIPVVAAAATQRVYVYKLIMDLGSPGVSVTLQDTGGGAISQTFTLLADASLILDSQINGDPWFTAGTGLGVQVFQSGTTNIGLDLYFLQGP